MFTGIVEELGKILKISDSEIHIQASVVLSDLEVKDSVSVNGVCLTAVEKSDDNFLVNVVPETLRRTNLGTLSSGSLVNLERSVSYGGRIGGHLVQGHVDGTGEITEIIPDVIIAQPNNGIKNNSFFAKNDIGKGIEAKVSKISRADW